MGLELLWIVLVVCAVMSAVGFYKFVYFLSIGYGLAIAGGAITLGVMFFDKLSVVTGLMLVLFVLYGVRLSGFLLVRELKNAAYRKTLQEATGDEKKMPVFVLVTIWVSVAVLYTMQLSPVFYRFYNGASDRLWPVVGIVISAAGLILETIADQQKSAQKAQNPNMVATKGLYRFVRCPNYFGEILFWTGVLVGAVTALVGVWQWALAVFAYVCIVFIMFNGAQRLEKRQLARYGKDSEYVAYADRTPIILPLLPIYHLVKQPKEETKA